MFTPISPVSQRFRLWCGVVTTSKKLLWSSHAGALFPAPLSSLSSSVSLMRPGRITDMPYNQSLRVRSAAEFSTDKLLADDESLVEWMLATAAGSRPPFVHWTACVLALRDSKEAESKDGHWVQGPLRQSECVYSIWLYTELIELLPELPRSANSSWPPWV